jgi:Spy/CpxP family protein refolding chaperone
MRKFFQFIISALLGAMILSPPALAQGPPENRGWGYRGGRGMMMGPMHEQMHEHMMDWASRLNLTEEQRARLKELRDSYLRDTVVWRNDLVIKRFDLRDLLRDPRSDPNTVLATQREISDLESKIQERALLYQLEMRKVLTPEQIKLLPPGGGGMYGSPMIPGRGRGMGRQN